MAWLYSNNFPENIEDNWWTGTKILAKLVIGRVVRQGQLQFYMDGGG